MRVLFLLILVLLAGCSSAKVYHGRRVVDDPLPIAGGTKTITLPVTEAGPIPAEDERVRIEVAEFHISRKNPNSPTITWRFGFTAKRPQVIEQVIVEELSASEPLVVVRDDSPQLKKNYWSHSSETMDASPESQPWLYSVDTSAFVFKFTIKPRGESPMVYYQPAWFSGAPKEAERRGLRNKASCRVCDSAPRPFPDITR